MRLTFCGALLLAVLTSVPVTAQVLPPPPVTPTPPLPRPRASTPQPRYLADPQLDWNDPQTVTIHACNERSAPVSIAFVYPKAPQHTSSGWYSVTAGRCRDLGPFPTRRYGFAYYADARDGWAEGGATPYCVRPGRAFALAQANRYSPSQCPDGFQHRAFQWVRPSSAAGGWTYDLTFR
jgi:uncharacterized membrane protein